MFIHGKLDEVIPWEHSLDLIKMCKCPAKLITPEKMKHSSIDPKNEILVHMEEFIKLFCEDSTKDTKSDANDQEELTNPIYFPLFMYYTPCQM